MTRYKCRKCQALNPPGSFKCLHCDDHSLNDQWYEQVPREAPINMTAEELAAQYIETRYPEDGDEVGALAYLGFIDGYHSRDAEVKTLKDCLLQMQNAAINITAQLDKKDAEIAELKRNYLACVSDFHFERDRRKELQMQVYSLKSLLAGLENEKDKFKQALEDIEMSPRVLHKDACLENMQAIAARALSPSEPQATREGAGT